MMKMLGLTGGMHYIIMLMAASTASKWMDDDYDGQCPCMGHSPLNPYAFINNHILQSALPGSKINKPHVKDAEIEMEEDSQTEKPSSSPLDDSVGRIPDDLEIM